MQDSLNTNQKPELAEALVINANVIAAPESDVVTLQHRSREIIRLTAMGLKPTQIAKQIGTTPLCVKIHLAQPIVQQQVEKMQSARDASAMDVLAQIQSLAPKALGVLEKIMDDDNAKDADRLRAVETVITHSVPKQQASDRLSREDIEELKARARASGMIVDVAPLEVLG